MLIIISISASRKAKQNVAKTDMSQGAAVDEAADIDMSKLSASALYAQANELLSKGEYLKAKEALKRIIVYQKYFRSRKKIGRFEYEDYIF